MSARYARQVDYDHMVNELVTQQGSRWEDAILEVDETFAESGYDLNSLFRYRNEEEFKQKSKAESYVRMFEQLLSGQDASVNLVFGIQGLTQNIQSRASEVIRVGTLRLIEQKKLFATLIRVMAVLAESADAEIEDNSDGEDDDDDDEDEHKLLQKQHILSFLLTLAQYPRDEYLDFEGLFCLSEELMPLLKTAIDADCGEPSLMDKYCDVLSKLILIRLNRDLLKEASIANELTVAKKMLKNKVDIIQKIDLILSNL